MKIWLKIMGDDVMLKNTVLDIVNFQPNKFHEYLHEACQSLDEPTPVIVTKHINHFMYLNCTSFSPEDFVEEVHFFKMIVEAIPDEKTK